MGFSRPEATAWIAILLLQGGCSDQGIEPVIPCIGRLILYHCLLEIPYVSGTPFASVACFFPPLIISFDEDVHNFDVVQFIRGFPLWSIYIVSIWFKTADSKVINVFLSSCESLLYCDIAIDNSSDTDFVHDEKEEI